MKEPKSHSDGRAQIILYNSHYGGWSAALLILTPCCLYHVQDMVQAVQLNLFINVIYLQFY